MLCSKFKNQIFWFHLTRFKKQIFWFHLTFALLLSLYSIKNATFWLFLSLNQNPSNYATTILGSPDAPKIIKGSSTRAMLAHWTGPINLAAFEAWIVYHHKRWNIVHVDIYVYWEIVEKVEAYFKDSKHTIDAVIKVFGHDVDQNVNTKIYHKYLDVIQDAQNGGMQKSLANAKRDGNDFFMHIDPDEFLDSSDFKTVGNMFDNNATKAVTIPLFLLDYGFCTDMALDFGSLGYQGVRPIKTHYTSDETSDFYTDPGTACHGQRKYIVRSDRWDRLMHVHDPLDCYRFEPVEGIMDMTGRSQDGMHVRLLHLRRKRSGIQADTSFHACESIHDCELLDHNKNTCVESLSEASFRLVPSEMQKILSGYPLYDNMDEFIQNATCYASGHSILEKELCPNLQASTCQVSNLFYHYEHSGQKKQWKWGCS